jgi:5'-3' exoribonuclease 2
MAIDGVAPRAKMNQQRSRRFRAAKEMTDAASDAERVREDMIQRGERPPPRRKAPWDSNAITPGTAFMHKLAEHLRFYVHERLTNNRAWRSVKVILSDANTPGEGEHKIMAFIRNQRTSPGYDPGTRHCLYGLDADLIMLGLATHEVRFTLLREEVVFKKKGDAATAAACASCGIKGHRADLCPSASDAVTGDCGVASGSEDEADGAEGSRTRDAGTGGTGGGSSSASALEIARKPFELLHISVLREYLAFEFAPQKFSSPLPFAYDFERIIDDFVFMCMFVGNDFLPHLPSLSIREVCVVLQLLLFVDPFTTTVET